MLFQISSMKSISSATLFAFGMHHILNPIEAEYPLLSLPFSVQEELVGIIR
jgi:hypothetical protein